VAERERETLSESEIVRERVSRRSALAILGAVALSVAGGHGSARAQVDNDRSDRARTGRSDSDTGPHADLPGQGRVGPRGCTDSDSGSYADTAGNGRCRRCSDSDEGRFEDAAGYGRRC
jgi:hypothetical protein